MAGIIYARQSTDEAKSQKYSLDTQQSELQKIAERDNLNLSSDFIPQFMQDGIIREKHSAFKTGRGKFNPGGLWEYQSERPKFSQMLTLLIEKKYDFVLVLCWDRISRNEMDDIILKNLIRGNDIKVIFAQGDYDLSTSSGRMMATLSAMQARESSETTSEKVKLAFSTMKEEGRWLHKAPPGFINKRAEDDASIILQDPERLPLVIEMFRLAATELYSLKDLQRWALEVSLTTLPHRRRRTRAEILDGIEIMGRSTFPLTAKMIHDTLTNRFYLRENDKGKKIPKDQLPEEDEDWQPVDIETFNRVQEILNGKNTRKNAKKIFKQYIYRKKLKCACNYLLSPYMQKNKTYYGCHRKGCGGVIREDQIDEEIAKVVFQYLPGFESLLEKLQKEDQEHQKIFLTPSLREAARRDLQDKKIALAVKLTKIHHTYIDGEFNKEIYAEMKASIADEIKNIENSLHFLTVAPKQTQESISFLEPMIHCCKHFRNLNEEEKKGMLHILFLELVIKDKKIRYVKLRPRIEELLKMEGTTLGWGGGAFYNFLSKLSECFQLMNSTAKPLLALRDL